MSRILLTLLKTMTANKPQNAALTVQKERQRDAHECSQFD